MKINYFKPVFISRIPNNLKNGILYVCLECDTVIHKCACGCGETVVTPTSENGWTFIYKDSSVSLRPSIGNYNYKCKSHYYITNNNVIWLNNLKPTNLSKKKKRWWHYFAKNYTK